jgi:hypothetical protein
VLDCIAVYGSLAAAASPFIVKRVAERAHLDRPEAEFTAVRALLQQQFVSLKAIVIFLVNGTRPGF